MSRLLNRLWQVLSGLLILLTAAIIIASPYVESNGGADGTLIVLAILSVAMLGFALRQLWIYFTMARFMVGGKGILFEGLIALDFAIFLMSLNDVRAMYIMIYLVVIYFASGAIDLFRALEIRRMRDGSWKWKAAFGLLNLVIAVLCIIFIRSNERLCLIYGIGLLITGLQRIAKAFRKTKLVYVQ